MIFAGKEIILHFSQMACWLNMQIMNKVVCGTSKGSLYKQIKPVLVGEHDLPLTFICLQDGSSYTFVVCRTCF